MKILLVGKTGQLGGDLLRNGKDHEIYAPEKNILNIESKEAIESIIDEFKPSVVINTAAFHKVPLCEQEFEKALSVNCVAVRDLAIACKKSGILLVTFSTDYVFSGSKRTPYLEDDPPQPIQMYGISKLAGEFSVSSVAPDHSIIIRTCGLYGISGAKSKGGNFVDNRIKDAKSHSILEIGCDQTVGPTYTDDLSKAVLKLIGCSNLKPGIYHLVNEGECTWYEFTKTIYEVMGLHIEVKPVDRNGMSGEMRRPLYSVLANTKAKGLGIELPHWRNGLKRYLKEKYGI